MFLKFDRGERCRERETSWRFGREGSHSRRLSSRAGTFPEPADGGSRLVGFGNPPLVI